MRALLPPAALLLAMTTAACGERSGTTNAIDVDAAANQAQQTIDNYDAVAPEPAPTSTPPPPPVDLPSPTPSASPIPTSAPTAAEPTDQDAAAAAAVVRAYADALAAKRYRAAWLLWGDQGALSGMSAAAFAQSFAKYATIKGEVGTPYDADAGAGQRYITVPLTLSGTLVRGGRFVMRGPVILHHVAAEIEVPDPTKHLWRIDRSELKPRPIEANAAP